MLIPREVSFNRRRVLDRIGRTLVRWQTSRTPLWCRGSILSQRSGEPACLVIRDGVLETAIDGTFRMAVRSPGGSFAAFGAWDEAIIAAVEERRQGVLVYLSFATGALFIADYDAAGDVMRAARRIRRFRWWRKLFRKIFRIPAPN